MTVNLSRYQNRHAFSNKCGRFLWNFVWQVAFRWTPRCCYAWRRLLLRLFGAKLGFKVIVHPSCRIWAPWHLTVGDYSCLGPHVDCYSVDHVTIGKNVTISQDAMICTASHDISDPSMELVTAPITIDDGAWICARAFVGPGVHVGNGAVIGACAVVTHGVDSWNVVAGNPARLIRIREVASHS